MDHTVKSSAAQIVMVNITMEMVTISAAPSLAPSAQSPPSLSRSTPTDPSPNQASGQHGQLKIQIQLQLQQIHQRMDAGVGLKELEVEVLKIGLLEELKLHL